MALSADKILGHAGVFSRVEVHVPAWADETGDDVVLVRGMTIREYEIVQAKAPEGMSTASVMAKCIVDESGSPIFTTANVAALAELPTAQVLLINKAITDQSGLGADDAKNSESPSTTTGESDVSSSDSPVSSDVPSPS
jgi:hypothetical protein